MQLSSANVKQKIKNLHLYQIYRAYANILSTLKKRGVNRKTLCREAIQYKICLTARSKTTQLEHIFQATRIQIIRGDLFQSWIDEKVYVCNTNRKIENMSPNYRPILEHSIQELLESNLGDNSVLSQNRNLLLFIQSYIDRAIAEMQRTMTIDGPDKNLQETILHFKRMKTDRAKTLQEALQRILFWSSLFWQTGHKLIGLGRIDKLLDPYMDQPNDEKAKTIIKAFLCKLHAHYAFKSNELLGDTGQILILGGREETGGYFCNRYTYLFIDAIRELEKPDPKTLLRVSSEMPRTLMETALHSIATGVGGPLLSNDDVVIPALISFGYKPEDAHNYIVSACWEPLSYGNSLEQNNLACVNYAKVFASVLKDDAALHARNLSELITLYGRHMTENMEQIKNALSGIKWERDPLFTLFTVGCAASGQDLSDGGSVYKNYGILSVGLANTVDSLLKLDDLVFKTGTVSMKELINNWKSDFSDSAKLFEQLKIKTLCFGMDDERVISIAKQLSNFVSEALSDYSNPLGGKVKYGLSSPSYVSDGQQTEATLDSRRSGEALSVHISASAAIAYTELFSFASRLDYQGNRSNGNVIDYIVPPNLIYDNFDKFVDFLLFSIKRGFFQMQMNVVSSAMLIAARKAPEQYPNLIVRVWGFSSYFTDLPDEYKDVLIRRALESEHVV